MHSVQTRQPCILCKQGNQSKYFHPKSWKDASLMQCLRPSEPSLNILPESCIRLSRDDLSKLGNEGHIPRRRNIEMKRGTGNKIWYVPACSNPSFKVTQVANKTSLEQLFDISSENIPPVPASNEEKGYPLCKEHYGALYRQVNPTHFTKKYKT